MSNLSENYTFIQFLLLNLLAIILGYLIKFSLEKADQRWVQSFHQTMSYLLLPSITAIITLLISSNIALSLGMIGALSIVRFRTPVKSPLELVMFFALITIGIGIAVNYKFSVLLTLIIILVLTIFTILNKHFQKKNKTFFINSYDEGMNGNILEVHSKKNLKFLEENKNLENYYFNKGQGLYSYRLIFNDKNDLNIIKKKIEENTDIDSVDIKYAL
jgi:uncharacterized membrane protein YhiD involved in acid resistance